MTERKKNPIHVHIGQRILLARAREGMSEEELAKAVGVPLSKLQGFEAGKQIGVSGLFAIAAVLSQPIGFFYEKLLGPK